MRCVKFFWGCILCIVLSWAWLSGYLFLYEKTANHNEGAKQAISIYIILFDVLFLFFGTLCLLIFGIKNKDFRNEIWKHFFLGLFVIFIAALFMR
jgi:hypothetical protein